MNPRIFLQTIITLATASLGLVAALAWNEAIEATIVEIVGEGDDLVGLYTYAVLATIIAVTVVVLLGIAAAKAGSEATVGAGADD